MALTFKGAKICATDIVTNITRAKEDFVSEGQTIQKGTMLDASICYYNAVYTEFGVVIKPNQSRLTMADIPPELLARYDAVMTEMYELNANQMQIEADSAIYPPKEEEPIIPPLDPLPPL